MKLSRHLAARISFFLLPGTCVLCGANTQRRLDLCRPCDNDLPWNETACQVCALPLAQPGTCASCAFDPPPFDFAFAALRYSYPIDRLIPLFKAGSRLDGRVLSTLLAQRFLERRKDDLPDCWIPVPMTTARRRVRGFNQAEDIARYLAIETNIAAQSRICVRTRDTPEQKSLSASARRRNLEGTFEVKASLAGAHVGIVDDVVTTKATVSAMSIACLDAGAERVSIIAIARTPEPELSRI